jgi:hypothetical protein
MTHDIAPRQDDLIRSTSRIDDAELARNLDPVVRDALLASLVEEPEAGRSWGGRHRRLSIALGVAAALVASSAAAVAGHEAWQREHPAQSVTVNCVEGQDAQHQPAGGAVPIPTGDPLADCAAVWELSFGEAAPEMAAYTSPEGWIMVQPKAWATPDDWTPLAGDFTFDSTLLELDHSLQDEVRGLRSRCFSTAEARSFVEAQLSRLGLTGWAVEQLDPAGDDGGPCASYLQADPEGKVVHLGEADWGSPEDLPVGKMISALRKAPACLPHDEAVAAIKRAAHKAGIRAGLEGYVLVEPYANAGKSAGSGDRAADPACARIVMIVGGGVTVELWG